MVVHNLDDIMLNFKHLPKRRGAILFTSRDRGIRRDEDWWIAIEACLELQQMSPAEAFQMYANMGLQVASKEGADASESAA
jgi:hypothetical protein